MKETDSKTRAKLAWRKIALLGLFLLIFMSGNAAATLVVSATPPSANITPDLNNVVNISYLAQSFVTDTFGDNPVFGAISTQGELRLDDGTVVETISSSVIINGINYRGMATETLIVPARAVTAARNAGKNRLTYQRTFTSTNTRVVVRTTVDVSLWFAPSSAGQFSLSRIELAFNLPTEVAVSRPASGGRITLPRNTRGLGAVATLNYSGSGTLRGQWKVDNQILQFVTQRLNPGTGAVTIDSPVVPAFPTYASGLHKVEFDVLEPAPGFTEPAIYYFVTESEPLPAAGSLKLLRPMERDQLLYSGGIPPQFSWQTVAEGVLYLFRLRSLDLPDKISGTVTDGSGDGDLLTAALTRDAVFSLTPFDLVKLRPGRPYLWQVQAFRGAEMIAISHERLVYFAR